MGTLSSISSLLADAKQAYSGAKLKEAEALLGRALEVSPNHVEALVLLGIVSARVGNRAAAITRLQTAIRLDARSYEAHIALSTLLFADGRPGEAIFHGERAIAISPSDPESYRHLARDLMAHGKSEDAISYLHQGLKLSASNPSLIQDLAFACSETGRLAESLELWRKLTRFHPNLISGWLKLGGMYLAARRFSEAVVCGRKAVSLDSFSSEARILVGIALLEDSQPAEAEMHLRHAASLNPNDMVAYSALGYAYQEMGRFGDARPAFERVLELCPTNGQAYHSLIQTQKTTVEDRPMLERMGRLLSDPAASVMDRSYMHYALGKAHEDLGDYESSIGSYEKATEFAAQVWFKNRPFDRDGYSSVIQATIDTFGSPIFGTGEETQLYSELPILIVGMIRSGTTLVEQILSSHPMVKGAGELSYWHDEIGKAFNPKARTLDRAQLRTVAQGYLEQLGQMGSGFERVTDKMPHNYALLGFVLSALPSARVIYVKRNPIDNCLSIFTTAYQHPPEFTLSRANIVFAYREHERIMAHWKAVLPAGQLLEVAYEDIVVDREAAARRMIEFAGLNWDDSCLHHEQNARVVSTPSAWQVRQPIYATSVERWRRFEPWLGEFDELRPPV